MAKYFDTKPGSLEEAVSAAQQAAIAISKKERGEKPKDKKDEDASQFAFVAQKAKEKGDDTFMFAGKKYDTETEELVKEDNTNDKSDDGDGLDKVQPKAVKKKFKDRKDKDINNDGEVDASDKFLHKRRKAISKAIKTQGEAIKSVAESVRMMWDEAAKKNEAQDMEQDKDGDGMDDDGKAKKTGKKTDSGKEMTPVDMSPKMPKTRNEKNKV